MLSAIEDELRKIGCDHALANAYRQRAVTHGQYDRSIDFFLEWVEADPDNDAVRLELSVAYVDKIPTCGGLAAVVCKGTLARKSLDVLDEVLERRPDWWTARYGRGMNHLHWPRALRHSADAVTDFSRALELQRAGSGPTDEHRERVYLLLGDAQAKNKSYADARRTWSAGVRLFPGSQALGERLVIEDDAALLDFVLDIRALERPIDTDFSFFER